MVSASNFVHIPRTGGNTLFKAIGMPDAVHIKAKYIKHDFKFTVIRNPYSRAVAICDLLYGDSEENFKRCVKENFTGVAGDNNAGIWYYGTQHQFDFADPMNEFLNGPVNCIIRFENMAEEFAAMCKTMSVENNLEWFDIEPDYKRFYDDETYELVTKKYKDDLTEFGYSF